YWKHPIRRGPRDEDVTYQSDQWFIRPAGESVRSRAVFLVDSRAMSAAESILQMIEAYHLGTIVGETTGGTNGDPTEIDLPGGFALRFSALQVEGPTGRPVHGVGVVPTVKVAPTKEGIASGKDEVLDAALALFSN